MEEPRKYRHLVSAVSGFMLLAALTAFFAFVWQQYYAEAIVAPFFRRGNWVVILIYTVLTALVFKAYGCTKFGYLKRSDLIYYQAIGVLIVNVITYFQVSVIGRNFMRLTPMLLLTVADWCLVVAWTFAVTHISFRLFPPRRLVIVYGSKKAAELVLKMSTRVDKYMICESISCAVGMRKITDAIDGFDGVILCEMPAELRNDVLKYCCARRIRAYVAPKISDILMRGGDDLRLFDTPLVLCRNEGLSLWQRFWKRAFDLAVSLVLLILLSPVFLVCAAAIIIEDGGDVFFRQKRLTRDGRVFEILKFRSMIRDAEADGVAVLAAENDERITRTGAVLRRFRLDELPQLINILRGDMSLVGPRPERPEIAEEITKTCPEFVCRLQVKAGLTGYAQVTGAYDTEPIDKLKMDLMYIEQYAFLRDVQIVLMTLKIMLFPPKMNQTDYTKLHEQQQEEEEWDPYDE